MSILLASLSVSVVCVGGAGKLVNEASVNVLLVAMVGQRSGRGLGNKILLWVVSDYSFGGGRVNDVNT